MKLNISICKAAYGMRNAQSLLLLNVECDEKVSQNLILNILPAACMSDLQNTVCPAPPPLTV
jgi:hypothetical protein